MTEAENLLVAAESVASLLVDYGVPSVVIGAVALAAHRHLRYTEDIDLGVNADLPTLRTLTKALSANGLAAILHEPDAQDPLGGVIDVRGAFGLVQIISFCDRFPAVIEDAIKQATVSPRPGSPLRIAPIPHLIALKLYAGGIKSHADIAELLIRNPQVDIQAVCALCARYELTGLEVILHDLNR